VSHKDMLKTRKYEQRCTSPRTRTTFFVSGIQTVTTSHTAGNNNNYGLYSGATVSFCRPDKRIMTDERQSASVKIYDVTHRSDLAIEPGLRDTPEHQIAVQKASTQARCPTIQDR
jgi:hypothetical protein